jgi:hypothetical protein
VSLDIVSKTRCHQQVAPVHPRFVDGLEKFMDISLTQPDGGKADALHAVTIQRITEWQVVSALVLQPVSGFGHILRNEDDLDQLERARAECRWHFVSSFYNAYFADLPDQEFIICLQFRKIIRGERDQRQGRSVQLFGNDRGQGEEEIRVGGEDRSRRGPGPDGFEQDGRRGGGAARKGDGKDFPSGNRAGKIVAAVDDLAGLPVLPAPEGERLVADQCPAARCAAEDDASVVGHASHRDSSRTISPATAELTQSSRLPNPIVLPSRPGA